MKRLLVLLLLFSFAAFAQPHDPVLDVTYPFNVDDSGFVELRALAVFNESGNFMCYNTSVNATVNGETHALDGQVGCYYTKFLQLEEGNYNIVFDASYPGDLGVKTASYSLKISGFTKPYVVTYSPNYGSTFRADDWMFIESAGFIKNSMVNGVMSAELINEFNETVNSMSLQSQNKVFKGWMKLNVTEGDYVLRVVFSSGDFSVKKEVSVKINNSALFSEFTSGAISMIYPRENQSFDRNEVVLFEVEFRDFNELFVKNAVVNMSIFKGGEFVDSVVLDEEAYTYVVQHAFEEAGKYELKFSGKNDKYQADSTYSLVVGNATEVAESENFVIEILVPQPDVYATNSEIIARARLRLNGVPVKASVKFFIDDVEVTPSYDSFGDYVYRMSSLLQGTHSIKAVSEYEGMAAVDYVEFMVSEHFLNISWKEPSEGGSVMLSKGDLLSFKASVFDETGDLMYGAFVIADIVEPNGREVQVRLFQDNDTGVYVGDYYPSIDGTCKLKVTASKSGYVSRVSDIVFDVVIEKQKILPEVDVNTAILIILAMAVIIFVLAFLKIIF